MIEIKIQEHHWEKIDNHAYSYVSLVVLDIQV